jgi:hypothetical protein
MKTLNVYLWKEWREHRVTLAGLGLALPLLMGLCAWLVPRKAVFADPIALNCSMALAVLAVVLAVGGELLAGDTRGSRLRFLERVPAGLSQAFTAKLFFYALVVVAAASYGWMLSAGAALACTGTVPEFRPEYALFLLPMGAVALWTFAAASWVPRGSLSLPTGLVLMAILGWPFGLYFASGSNYFLQSRELLTIYGLYVIGALVAARLSFVRGRRFDRSARHAAFLGIGVGVLFVLPVWAWAGLRLYAATHIDPLAKGFVIVSARLCEDGRHAAVSAYQQLAWLPVPPGHRLFVDLESGEWSAQWGTEACLTETEARFYFGLGWVRPGHGGTHDYYDPFRDRFFHPKEIIPDERERKRLLVLIGPGAWLLTGSHPDAWFRLDPESGERTELSWPDAGRDSSRPMLPDGRVFLVDEGSLLLGDPRDGSLTLIRVEGGLGPRVKSAYVRRHRPFEEEQPILLTDGERFYRFDAAALALEPIAVHRGDFIVTAEHDDAVLLVDRRARIVRMNLTSGAREVLFPRPEQ